MYLVEEEIRVPAAPGHRDLLSHIAKALDFRLANGAIPVRFAIIRLDEDHYHCEFGALEGVDSPRSQHSESIFRFVPR